jgi:hypothetical protein
LWRFRTGFTKLENFPLQLRIITHYIIPAVRSLSGEIGKIEELTATRHALSISHYGVALQLLSYLPLMTQHRAPNSIYARTWQKGEKNERQ